MGLINSTKNKLNSSKNKLNSNNKKNCIFQPMPKATLKIQKKQKESDTYMQADDIIRLPCYK